MNLRRWQRGYLLITVIVTLFLLATVAVLLTQDSAISANTASSELEAARAEYAARAGMQHALWRVANNACVGDLDVPATQLGADSYDAKVTGAAAGTSYMVAADQDAWIRNDDPTKNNGTSVTNHIRQETGKVEQVLTRFDVSSLPANAQINSAIAWFHLKAGKDHFQGSVSVHEIRADWAEATVTWDTFGGAYRAAPIGAIPPQPVGDTWVAVNVTGLVQAWVNGQPNHGLLMQTATEGIHTEYTAREDATNPPRLHVVVGSGDASPVTIKASGQLDNGVQRNLKDKVATTYQPSTWTSLQPDSSATEDSWITSGQTDWSYGAHGTLRVQPGNQRTLLRMDLQGLVPVGARVTEAMLELYAFQVDTSDGIDAHRIRRSWAEGTCFGSCGPNDGATWDTHDGANTWTAPGGDIDPAAAATAVPLIANDWVSWDITELVATWVADPSSNHGLMLKGNPGSAAFLSSDDADPALRPRMSIRYACECGSPCMIQRGSGNVLLVVANPASLLGVEDYKKSLMESWGYTVTLLDDDASQATYDTEVSASDIVYISASVGSGAVGNKLTDAPIGVVNEEGALDDELGFSSTQVIPVPVGDRLDVTDNSHYITGVFPAGPLQIYTADMGGHAASGTLAPGLQSLANWGSSPGLAVIDSGGALGGGATGNASARRVLVPFGQDNTHNWSKLNNNGRLIMQRAIAWGMGADETTSRAPIAHWKLDETSGTIAVDSIGGHDGNASNTTWTSGHIDGGLQFNSAADSVVVPHADELSITDQLTVAAWINKTGMFGYDAAVVKATTGSDLNYFLGTWENNPVFGFSTNTDNWQGFYATGTSLQIGNWYHLAATFDNTADTVSVYVDGELAQSFSTTLEPVANTGNVFLGRSAIGEYWPGVLDDVRIYDVALTAEEIAELVAPSGPVAHWKLDETSGTIAVDSVGGHDGTLLNGPTWTDGAIDGGVQFSGSTQAISVAHADSLTISDDLTLAGWFYLDEMNPNRPIVMKGTSNIDLNYYLGISQDQIQFAMSPPGGGWYSLIVGALPITTGAWYHAAVSFDNDSKLVRFYLDGVEVGNKTSTHGPSEFAGPVRIGRNDTGYGFAGRLDDVRIYRRALAADEIAEIAEPPLAMPIAHWKLDETSGTTAVDSVGGNDGQLNGSGTWTTGEINGGLAVDYTDGEDYIIVPNSTGLENVQEGDYTLAAWFRPASTPPGTSGDNDANYGILIKPGWHTGIFFTNQNRFAFWQHLDGDINIASTSGNTFSPAGFYHVAATVDRTAGLQSLYVNGQLEDTSGFTPGATAREYGTGTWGIGVANPSASSWGWPADGTLDDVRIYDRVLSAADISKLFALGSGGGGSGGGGGGPVYVEANDLWWPGSADTWETVDLSAYGVPANAVVEIALMNADGGRENSLGARAVGSSLERRVLLHEAEGGGNDVAVMHVQADANSRIQTYADRTNSIAFTLLGYWTGASYVERFDTFEAGANASWQVRDLGAYGVGPNQVAEIMISNTSTSVEWLVGSRQAGSALQRRVTLHESEGGGVDVVTMQVETDANANVEVYAEANSVVDFHVLGYWDTPPGTYSEIGGIVTTANQANAWHSLNAAASGVPANAVLQMALANDNSAAERQMGLRSIGSSLNRVISLQEGESGGADLATFHVRLDGNGQFQLYVESSTADLFFYPLGWWVLN